MLANLYRLLLRRGGVGRRAFGFGPANDRDRKGAGKGTLLVLLVNLTGHSFGVHLIVFRRSIRQMGSRRPAALVRRPEEEVAAFGRRR